MFSVEPHHRERRIRGTVGVLLVGFVVGAITAAISLPVISYFRLDSEASKPEWAGFCNVSWSTLSNEVTGGRLPEDATLPREGLLKEGVEYLQTTRPELFPEPIRDDLVELRRQAQKGGLQAMIRGVGDVEVAWRSVVLEHFGEVCRHRISRFS